MKRSHNLKHTDLRILKNHIIITWILDRSFFAELHNLSRVCRDVKFIRINVLNLPSIRLFGFIFIQL